MAYIGILSTSTTRSKNEMNTENFAAIESKKRRRRTTPQELQLLEEEYLRNPLPSASKRADIAQSVGM